MPTNEVRRDLLNQIRASGYPGSITEVFQAADQGIDLVGQFVQQQEKQQMQVAQTPQQQEVGLREEHARGNTQASMAFPDVQPGQSFNTVGMKAPIDIQKIDDQGHLVESYKNVPPGIQDLPTGPYEGTVIESPAAYQKGGFATYDSWEEGAKANPQSEMWKGKPNPHHKFSQPVMSPIEYAIGTTTFAPKLFSKLGALDLVVNPFIGLKNLLKSKVPHKVSPIKSSKIKFLDNVKDRVKYDASKDLEYYGNSPYISGKGYKIKKPIVEGQYTQHPDLTLTQKNLSSHLDKMGKSGKTTLYRYGDKPTGTTGNWYSADPMGPLEYQDKFSRGNPNAKIFKIEVENELLPKMYRGGPQKFLSKKPSHTDFKEFDVVEGLLRNVETFSNIKEYNKYLNTLKQKGGFNYKQYDVPEDLGYARTGFDDKLSVNPRVYRSIDEINTILGVNKKAANPTLTSYEFISDAARERNMSISDLNKKYNKDKVAASRIVNEGLHTVLKGADRLSDEEFQGLTSEVKDIVQGFKGDKNIISAMKYFYDADLSGIQEYREKMGLSREDVLNLIKPSDDASLKDKLKIKAIKQGLKLKKWKRGGLNKYQLGGKAENIGAFMGLSSKGTKAQLNPSINILGDCRGGGCWALSDKALRVGPVFEAENITGLKIPKFGQPTYSDDPSKSRVGKTYKGGQLTYESIRDRGRGYWDYGHFGAGVKGGVTSNKKPFYEGTIKYGRLGDSGIGKYKFGVYGKYGSPEAESPGTTIGGYGRFGVLSGQAGYNLKTRRPEFRVGLGYNFQKGGYKQDGGLRDHMMNYLHDTGRDTTYVNTVMNAIGQHESKNNYTQKQISEADDGTFYDGPGRGTFQFEVGPEAGGNTAINRTANFLKHNTDKNIRDFPYLFKLYTDDNSLDFSKLSKKDQEGLFIGDKIFGGIIRRNEFDALTRNRNTPPSQEEIFMYWLRNHKGKINGKDVIIETRDSNDKIISRDLNPDLTAEEIEIERNKWNNRTKSIFKKRKGGYKKSYRPKYI